MSGEFFRVRLYHAGTALERRAVWARMCGALKGAIALTAAMLVLASAAAPTVLGREYASLRLPILLLLLDVVPQFLGMAFGTLLLTNGLTRPNVVRHLISFAVVAAGCLVLPISATSVALVLAVSDSIACLLYLRRRSQWGIQVLDAGAVPV